MSAKSLIMVALMSVSTWVLAEGDSPVQSPAVSAAPTKIAALPSALEKNLQNPAAFFVSYKSREMADEIDAETGAESFRQALEKANYEVVRIKVAKEPTISEDVFQYSSIVLYHAKDGFQFKPIQKYYRDGFSSLNAAKKAYDAWLNEQSKKEAVVLVAKMQPMSPLPLPYDLMIDYAYPLKAQGK